jgi:hypothetical protein
MYFIDTGGNIVKMKILFIIQAATAFAIILALIFPAAPHGDNFAIPFALLINGIASLIYLPSALILRKKYSGRLNTISIFVSIFFMLINIAVLIDDNLLIMIMEW